MHRLMIYDGMHATSQEPSDECLSFFEFVAHVKTIQWWLRRIQSYREVRLMVTHLHLRSHPFMVSVLMYSLSRGSAWICDENGQTIEIRMSFLFVLTGRMLWDGLSRFGLLLRSKRLVLSLRKYTNTLQKQALSDSFPLYLKSDLWFSTPVGGSVTHMAGVVNGMSTFFQQPWVFSSVANPLVMPSIAFQTILPTTRYWDYRDLPALNFNVTYYEFVMEKLAGRRPAFIYHRYALHHFTGPWLAHTLNVPLVLEYNGSEVWIAAHWGKSPALGALTADIEDLNLKAASLIVVVSDVLQQDLLQRGVDSDKILVNPNGVNLIQFNPDIDKSQLLSQWHWDGKMVIGFIGTFGLWHGAEILVEAVGRIILQRPHLASQLGLLMIGDGVRRPASEALALRLGLDDVCLFTGSVHPLDSPKYLACCDILVAPNLANPDGSLFFGSPTKLFEYMAMGRAIVASHLGQISEVLEDGVTGLLVDPGNASHLADALALLVQNAMLRTKLGKAARAEAEAKHSWHAHVDKIATALSARVFMKQDQDMDVAHG